VNTLIAKLEQLYTKALVLLTAVPTWGAAIIGVLAAIELQVVPLLPGDWQVRAASYIAGALAAIATIVKTVARVTPVKAAERGLLPPSG
jgi:hypothetical protein